MNAQENIDSNKGSSSSTERTGAASRLGEFSGRLIQLSDGRPGLRAALPIEAQSDASARNQTTGSAMPIIDFISSNATLDRYDEVIRPEGWRLENYRRNPVFQNAHQYGDIIFTLGKALLTEVRTTPSPHLFQRIEFAVDVNPMARIAYGLYKNKFLNAVSVGFIPLRWQNEDGTQHTSREVSDESSLSRNTGSASTVSSTAGGRESQARRIYLEQELLEVSAVGIPANPEALQLGLKAGVLQKSDLKELLELLVENAEAKMQNAEALDPAPGPASILDHQSSSDLPSSSFSSAASNTPAGAPGVGGDGAQLLQLARALREVLRRS